MTTNCIPIERFLFGNEHWRSYHAINETEVYCDILDNLQARIDSLEVRGKDEGVTLTNVQAVISGYAIEIAMKSLWALDNSPKTVPHEHNLAIIFDGLKEETVKSLQQLQLTRKDLESSPQPFLSNRYSMEHSRRSVTIYKTEFLRSLIDLLREKLEETKEALFKPTKSGTA